MLGQHVLLSTALPREGAEATALMKRLVRRDAGKEPLGLLWISTEMPLGTLTLLFAL